MKVYEIPFEIEAAYAVYEALLTDTQGEITPQVEEAEANLKAVLEQGADKIESACCVIRNLESSSIALKAEAARLMERGQQEQNSVDCLKKLIGSVLPTMGGKVKTPKFTCWLQKNPSGFDLSIAPEVDIPVVAKQFPELFKITVEPRKSVITEKFKQGETLPEGFVISEKPETFSTRIK